MTIHFWFQNGFMYTLTHFSEEIQNTGDSAAPCTEKETAYGFRCRHVSE